MNAVSIYITTSNKEEAKKIGNSIVRARLAACANIIDSMESIYWWEGKVQEEHEAVLLLKTREELADRVIALVKSLHSYDVPCIVAWPIVNGDADYLKWIEEETSL